MAWTWGEPRKDGILMQGSHSSSSCSNSSAMIFPLAVALAYLDAIAKTWLAIGEKLHESIYGNANSSNDDIPKPMTQAKTPCKNSGYNWQHHGNILEFSLGDFLRWKMHDPYGNSSSSSPSKVGLSEDPSNVSEEVHLPSSNGQVLTPSTSTEEDNSNVSATSNRSWSRCLRLARRPKLLPPSPRPRATDKTLVLDLDETLIHAPKHSSLGDGRFDFMVVLPPRTLGGIGICSGRAGSTSTSPSVPRWFSRRTGKAFGGWTRRNGLIGGFTSSLFGPSKGSGAHGPSGVAATGGGERRVYVRKRPHLQHFLRAVSSQFEVVVFTAAREDFAMKVLQEIDPNREMVDHVLSRESCTRLRLSRRSPSFVKDLGVIGRPLSKVIMVENSLDAIRYHLENGIHISSFYGDRSDRELLETLEVLRQLAPAADVRDAIISRYVQAEARKAGHVGSLDAPLAPAVA